jgi:flagellar assembly protein FliH
VLSAWRIPDFVDEQCDTLQQQEPQPDYASLAQRATEEGFAAGRLAGLEAGKQQVEAAAAQFMALANALSRPFIDLDQQVVKELSGIALAVASQIVRRQIALDPTIVNTLVTEALAMLSTLEGDTEIWLNPADVDRVQAHLRASHQSEGWRLCEDATIAQGGCRVKTPDSYIDMSLERQLAVALNQLLESSQDAEVALPSPAADTDSAALKS